MADMIVSGAGTTAVNGTYSYAGIENGKPKYTKDNYILLWFVAGYWMIYVVEPLGYYYISFDDVATPDLCTAWGTAQGIQPAPTVTAASSGTTHEGEATLSSFSYLRSWKYRTPWWLAGGIAAANCVAAYQPKGAADYAASKVNLTGNTTYDAVEGSTVSWNATDGWVAGSSGYLKSGIIAVGNQWSMILRFTNGGVYGNSMYWGCMTSGKRWAANVNMGSFARCYIGNYADIAGGNITTGVYAFAGGDYYINGSYFGTVGNAINNTTDELYLLGYNTGGTPSPSSAGKFQAMAFYNTVLTPTQVSLLTTAMAAL